MTASKPVQRPVPSNYFVAERTRGLSPVARCIHLLARLVGPSGILEMSPRKMALAVGATFDEVISAIAELVDDRREGGRLAHWWDDLETLWVVDAAEEVCQNPKMWAGAIKWVETTLPREVSTRWLERYAPARLETVSDTVPDTLSDRVPDTVSEPLPKAEGKRQKARKAGGRAGARGGKATRSAGASQAGPSRARKASPPGDEALGAMLALLEAQAAHAPTGADVSAPTADEATRLQAELEPLVSDLEGALDTIRDYAGVCRSDPSQVEWWSRMFAPRVWPVVREKALAWRARQPPSRAPPPEQLDDQPLSQDERELWTTWGGGEDGDRRVREHRAAQDSGPSSTTGIHLLEDFNRRHRGRPATT